MPIEKIPDGIIPANIRDPLIANVTNYLERESFINL
jgi:hypothetical protein